VKLATLYRSSSGSITGEIYFSVDGAAFPEEKWSDFPVVILGWWLEALGALRAGERRVELDFMDGPYTLRVSSDSGDALSLEFTRNGNACGFPELRVEHDSFLRELLLRSAELISHCKAHGWDSRDIRLLERLTATKSQ
jgi:hypothetical protein